MPDSSSVGGPPEHSQKLIQNAANSPLSLPPPLLSVPNCAAVDSEPTSQFGLCEAQTPRGGSQSTRQPLGCGEGVVAEEGRDRWHEPGVRRMAAVVEGSDILGMDSESLCGPPS